MDAAGEFVAQNIPGHTLNQFIVGGGSKVTEVIIIRKTILQNKAIHE